MMTLIGCFSESANVSLPFLLAVFEPIVFSFVIPDITPYITCTRAHLKAVTSPKFLSCLEFWGVHN